MIIKSGEYMSSFMGKNCKHNWKNTQKITWHQPWMDTMLRFLSLLKLIFFSLCRKTFSSPCEVHCRRFIGTIRWSGSFNRLSKSCLDMKDLWIGLIFFRYFHVSECQKPRLYARFALRNNVHDVDYRKNTKGNTWDITIMIGSSSRHYNHRIVCISYGKNR
jgi:hypothetical protein